jgi:hypothetical protein
MMTLIGLWAAFIALGMTSGLELGALLRGFARSTRIGGFGCFLPRLGWFPRHGVKSGPR